LPLPRPVKVAAAQALARQHWLALIIHTSRMILEVSSSRMVLEERFCKNPVTRSNPRGAHFANHPPHHHSRRNARRARILSVVRRTVHHAHSHATSHVVARRESHQRQRRTPNRIIDFVDDLTKVGCCRRSRCSGVGLNPCWHHVFAGVLPRNLLLRTRSFFP